MSRSTSITARRAMFSQQTPAVFLEFLTIVTNDSPSSTIRLVNNTADITYDGDLFTAWPFALTLPKDENGRLAEAAITMDNVARVLIDEIRSYVNPLSVKIEVVNVSESPMDLVASYDGFDMLQVSYDTFTVTGKLSIENFMNEPFPQDVISVSKFGGVF